MEDKSRSRVRSTQLGSDHQRPVPVGVAIKAPTERGYGTDVTVFDAVRGSKAQMIVAAGEASADDMEYLRVDIRFGYYCKAKGSPDTNAAYLVTADSFQAASADGSEFYDVFDPGHDLQQGLIGRSVPVGDFIEGRIMFRIPKDEKQPLLVFHRRHAHSDFVLTSTWQPVWFRLSADDPMVIEGSCADCRV